MAESGFVVLESGETFPGLWRGGRARAGEVVFNTSHSGYEEMATDPSYFSQILVTTAPMMGNYGVNRDFWESRKLWIQGFVCVEIQSTARDSAWCDQLIQAGIPLLSNVDTRKLTIRLREMGTTWGALVPARTPESALQSAQELIRLARNQDRDWVYAVSRTRRESRPGLDPNGPRVAILDYGCKENTIKELERRCREVEVFPSRTLASELRSWNPDGVLLSNGPGDPADVIQAVETVRDLIGWRPIMGICMGHQILALALGAKTYKLKFGHRGSNHPVRDELLNRVYMTSQNHGYAVLRESLPEGVVVSHTNLNDQTVSGIFSGERNLLGVQFHPESRPGPHDAETLFDFFVKMMR